MHREGGKNAISKRLKQFCRISRHLLVLDIDKLYSDVEFEYILKKTLWIKKAVIIYTITYYYYNN